MSKKITVFLATLLTIFLLIWLPVRESFAGEEDETSGLQANVLTINVGYYGTRYYQKKVFSVNELSALGLQGVVYSYIDRMPAVCLSYAKGVPLSTIMEASGIDINSIQRFYFYTNDNKGGYFTDFLKKDLLDTTRYYYPNLVFRYYEPDFAFKDDQAAVAGAIPVPTMIVVSDSWKRHLPGPDDFGEIDYSDSAQRARTRFRLLFGQLDPETSEANRSAKWVHSIEVMLGGGPTITTDISVLEKEVGSNYRITATVTAADDLLAEQIKQSLVWSSSDPDVATVDSQGNVTIIGEGDVVITVSYFNVNKPGELLAAASVRVTGVGPSSSGGENKTVQPDDKSEAAAEAIALPGGISKGLFLADRQSQKAGIADGPVKKRTIMKSGETVTGAFINTTYALRLGNVNRTEGLLSIFTGGEKDQGNEGTVQNWRKTEMADTATPLGWIDDPVSLKKVLIASLILLLVSIVGRAAEFYLAL